jgi:hypothetical protein
MLAQPLCYLHDMGSTMLHSQDTTLNKVYLCIYHTPHAHKNMQHTKLKQVKQLECVII